MATDNKNLVYPWDDEKFTGSKADKLSVYENLRKLKYPINLYKEVPDKKICTMSEGLVKNFAIPDKWVFVLCNSGKHLQAIAALTPILYSLTTMYSCINVTTEKLHQLFTAKKPIDDFMYDPVGESLSQMESAGLLVWEDILERVPDSLRVSAKYVQLLKKRAAMRCSTMFTMLYIGRWRQEEGIEKIKMGISNSLGETAYGIIMENVEFINFEFSKEEIPKLQTVKI